MTSKQTSKKENHQKIRSGVMQKDPVPTLGDIIVLKKTANLTEIPPKVK